MSEIVSKTGRVHTKETNMCRPYWGIKYTQKIGENIKFKTVTVIDPVFFSLK